jgi:hypothetical protein
LTPEQGPLNGQFWPKNAVFLQSILKRLQTAVGPALLQEKTFDIVSVDEKMLFGD